MARGRSLVAAIIAVGSVLGSSPATATTQRDLDEARRRAAGAQDDLLNLMYRYREAALSADDAAARSFSLRLQAEQAQASEDESRHAFERSVRDVYIDGTGAGAELILGASSIADIEAGLPYAKRVLDRTHRQARLIESDHLAVLNLIAASESAQADVLARERSLGELRYEIVIRLEALRAKVRSAEAALVAAGSADWQALLEKWLATRTDVDRTIALRRRARGEAMFAAAAPYLGPRTDCMPPAGLQPTGEVLHGEASFYGKEFAGRNTATGAVFDPSRFTVAHKTLPFGLFLMIKLNGRCVVSLLNDRGPYVDGRILDLSEASAKTIGVHVNDVDAVIYVRR